MATIKDIAKHTGLSVATVSRVLNRHGYLSQKTIDAVQDAMLALNYQPNELARSLQKARTNILGLILPNVQHPFMSKMLHHFEHEASLAGFKLMLCNSQHDRNKELAYIDLLKRNQADGIILCSRHQDIDDYLHIDFPLVSVDRQVSERVPFVSSDHYMGGQLAVNALYERGCRHLAYIAGSTMLNLFANRRTDGFIDQCNRLRLPYVITEADEAAFTNMDYAGIAEALLESHPEADGIFASSDVIATQVVRAAARLGRSIPDDLKLVGYDDTFVCSLTTPSISAIHQPVAEICRTALALLQSEILRSKTNSPAPVPTNAILPVTLVIRESL